MANADAIFRNRKVKPAQLLPFGFLANGNTYTYSTDLIDGQFEMTVTVTGKGKVAAEVIDVSSREPYLLHRIASEKGPFVSRVREKYEGVLSAIANTCFEPDVFKSKGAKQIIQYVREKYRDELQYLWQRFPQNAIFRRKDSGKWYAALLVLRKTKLGLKDDGMVEIIDLRGKPEDIETLVDGKKYFPGFHMNKKHWFTICLDGSVPIKEILSRIDDSFALATK